MRGIRVTLIYSHILTNREAREIWERRIEEKDENPFEGKWRES